MNKTSRYCGWAKTGNDWQKISERSSRAACLDDMLDLAGATEYLILPRGQHPRPGQVGELRRASMMLTHADCG